MMLTIVGCSEKIDSKAEVQEITTVPGAIAKIVAYATDNSKPKPTVETYAAAGVKGVDDNNLSAVNAEVAVTDAAGVDAVAKIQAIATAETLK